jgi:hypothetical protein
VEAFLEGLARFGFAPEASVAVYRSFATFLLGHLLLESGTGAEEVLPAMDGDVAFIESNDLDSYPLVLQLSDLLRQDAYGEEFEESLEDLINRMALLRG